MTSRAEDILHARLEAMHIALMRSNATLDGIRDALIAGLDDKQLRIFQGITDEKMTDLQVAQLRDDIDQFNNPDN